jgi:hypothetical protein
MSSGSQIRNAVDDALAGRRYKFVVHGISDARRRQPSRGAKKRSGSRGQGQSRSKRKSTQPYSVDNPDDFNLNEFVKPERLFGVKGVST